MDVRQGTLEAGVTAAQAHANISLIGAQLAAANPVTNTALYMSAFPTNDVRLLVPQASGPISIGSAAVMSVVGLVLLIACANVAGMLLARASSRRREISIRLAIGAGRGQLVRQMLIEGLVLGLCGAAVAVLLAWTLIRVVGAIQLPIPGSLGLDLRLDLRVTTFAVLVAIAAGVLAALAPALKSASPRLASDLRGDVPVARLGTRRWSLREVLVVSQLALTVVLLVVAGLLLRTLGASQSADVGFRTDGLALISFDTDMVRYSRDRARQFVDDALARVKRMPGVEAAAYVTPRLPFDINFSQTTIRVDGKTYDSDTAGELVSEVAVTPEYFDTLGVPVLEGRGFTAADSAGDAAGRDCQRDDGAPSLAERSCRGPDLHDGFLATRPIKSLASSETTKSTASANGRRHICTSPRRSSQPRKHDSRAHARRGRGPSRSNAPRTQLMEPGRLFATKPWRRPWRRRFSFQRVAAMLAGSFGALGTLLLAITLRVIAYSVARRTREIGIRMALAPTRGSRLGDGDAARSYACGDWCGAGAFLAAGAARLLSGLIYGVGAADPIAVGDGAGLIRGRGGAGELRARASCDARSIHSVTALWLESVFS